MKTLRIDGRLQKVFVLRETDDRLVYIPVKSCFLVDYKKLLDLENRGGDLLKHLSNETLPNGRNALTQFDNLICVMNKKSDQEGERLRKPEEAMLDAALGQDNSKVVEDQPKQEEKPARRKPGPKKGSTRKPADIE